MLGKKILSIGLVCVSALAFGAPALAEAPDKLSAKGIDLQPLKEGDYLLDGSFENGELVDGFIYHSEEEAEAGMLLVKEMGDVAWADIFVSGFETEEPALPPEPDKRKRNILDAEQLDASGYTQQIVSQNIVAVRGSATLIEEDDYLLDGSFENGELVNGFIYYSKTEADEGLRRAQAGGVPFDVSPTEGNTEGVNENGRFSYTIRELCNLKKWFGSSAIRVDTQSKLYHQNHDTYMTSSDYSYIVTVKNEDGVVGSFRGYPDDVYGGIDMNGKYGDYWINITLEQSLPWYTYLNGYGIIKDR